MPSVVALLEQPELAACRRVDGLREEADRVQAELAAAEQERQEWTNRPQASEYGLGSGPGQHR